MNPETLDFIIRLAMIPGGLFILASLVDSAIKLKYHLDREPWL